MMNHNEIDEWKWTSNTLARTTQQAKRTLIRTKRRNFRYSEPVPPSVSVMNEPLGHISLDDAFTNVLKSLSDSSRQCLRYYRTSNPSEQNIHDRRFCAKYLKPLHHETILANSVHEKPQGLNVVVAPGTYSVTACSSRDGATKQTHVVKVGQGEAATLDFNL